MMSKYRTQIRDAALMTLILSVSFLSIVLMQKFYAMQTLAPMIFLLSVFLISLKTQGYFWGILASLLSVLAVNFAFTFPFFQFDFLFRKPVFRTGHALYRHYDQYINHQDQAGGAHAGGERAREGPGQFASGNLP